MPPREASSRTAYREPATPPEAPSPPPSASLWLLLVAGLGPLYCLYACLGLPALYLGQILAAISLLSFLVSRLPKAYGSRIAWRLALVSLLVGSCCALWLRVEPRYFTRPRLLRVGAALERFHSERGYWPASLDELTPQYLPSIPRPQPLRLGPWSSYRYYPGSSAAPPLLYVMLAPPFLRLCYSFRGHDLFVLD